MHTSEEYRLLAEDLRRRARESGHRRANLLALAHTFEQVAKDVERSLAVRLNLLAPQS